MKEVHVDADPNDVLSLVGSDGDLVDFILGNDHRAPIHRASTGTW